MLQGYNQLACFFLIHMIDKVSKLISEGGLDIAVSMAGFD